MIVTKAMGSLFSILALYGATLAQSNMALKYASTDNVLYVSKSGNDSNDGLTAGTAKATIEGALSALPPCSIIGDLSSYNSSTPDAYTFNHCGQINVAGGTYTVSSQISITSPYVTIRGSGSATPVLNWIGTAGCALSWTSSPFVEDGVGNGGLYNVRIDGHNGGAGTCGLETHELPGFHVANVVIANFRNGGSVSAITSSSVGKTTATVVANGTVTLPHATIKENACQTAVTASAPGVLTTDAVEWAYASTPNGLLPASVWVASGSVSFTRCNSTTIESMDATAIVINWSVIR